MDATVYLPTVAWRTIARDVIVLTAETISNPATYRVTVKPEDINELGAIAVDIAINYYFKDYIGHTYRIIAYSKANPSAITIDIADEFRVGVGAQEGRMAIVYRSVGDGLSPYLAPVYYRHLDRVALEYSRQFELDILWKKEQKPVFNGVCIIPTLTDNGDGSVTIGDNGHYHLAVVENGHDSDTFLINGGTFTLSNLQQNYIVANYNSGSPEVQHVTDVTLINETTVIPIYSIFRNGTVLHVQNWDTLGLALANKVHQSIVKTQRYRREYGLMPSEYGTRNLNLTAGRVWVGAVPVDLAEINTATDNLFFWHHSAGAWTVSTETQYNNSQYDNGTDLVSLTINRYAVNWVFRGVESQKHLYVVVGTGDYTLNQAQAATIPTLPPAIGSHAVLVAKIIVQQGSNTAVSIQSAFDTQFSAAPTANHTDLTNLAWSSSGHTGTANKIAAFDSGGNATYADPSSGGASPPTTVSSSTTNTDNGTTHTHELATSGVTAGTYSFANITVNNKGIITSAASGSGFALGGWFEYVSTGTISSTNSFQVGFSSSLRMNYMFEFVLRDNSDAIVSRGVYHGTYSNNASPKGELTAIITFSSVYVSAINLTDSGSFIVLSFTFNAMPSSYKLKGSYTKTG